jgi:hypothetical protein
MGAPTTGPPTPWVSQRLAPRPAGVLLARAERTNQHYCRGPRARCAAPSHESALGLSLREGWLPGACRCEGDGIDDRRAGQDGAMAQSSAPPRHSRAVLLLAAPSLADDRMAQVCIAFDSLSEAREAFAYDAAGGFGFVGEPPAPRCVWCGRRLGPQLRRVALRPGPVAGGHGAGRVPHPVAILGSWRTPPSPAASPTTPR